MLETLDQIKNSMKQCGITTATDGSDNHLIECFNPGNPCHENVEMLTSYGGAQENVSDHDLSEEDDEVDSDCCDSDESN